MQYFNNCTTIEEVKTLYKKLALENHPDRGGNTATMQAINTEYSFACAKILKGESLTNEEINEEIKMSELYRQVIEKIMPLPGIVIEIVGNWIWVSGATYPLKKELKEAGLLWASQKKVWYYRAEEYATRGGKKSLEEIKAKYGSQTVNKSYSKALK